MLSQCLSTEDTKYFQPINSNFFGRNSLPFLPLFYHFLEDRMEGVVAITEDIFILKYCECHLFWAYCIQMPAGIVYQLPQGFLFYDFTLRICIWCSTDERGKGRFQRSIKLSPSDKRNAQGRKSNKIFLKFSKYINHSVATLFWLEIQNRKRKLFCVSISSEPATQCPGEPVFEDPRVVTGRTDSRHSMQPVLRQKLQHGVWAFRILVVTSHSSWVAKKKQAFLWGGWLANNSKKQLKDRFIPGMMSNTKRFLRWLPKV